MHWGFDNYKVPQSKTNHAFLFLSGRPLQNLQFFLMAILYTCVPLPPCLLTHHCALYEKGGTVACNKQKGAAFASCFFIRLHYKKVTSALTSSSSAIRALSGHRTFGHEWCLLFTQEQVKRRSNTLILLRATGMYVFRFHGNIRDVALI